MIYNFYGETASGKDSIIKKLTNLGFKRIISHTTRPPRINEINGKDYWFESSFNTNNASCLRSFKSASGDVWHYWFEKSDIINAINSKEKYVSISDVFGTKELNALGAKSIFVYSDCIERVKRYYDRESQNPNPDYKEVLRRLIADGYDFKEIRHKALVENSIIWVNNIDIDDTVEDILNIINYINTN